MKNKFSIFIMLLFLSSCNIEVPSSNSVEDFSSCEVSNMESNNSVENETSIDDGREYEDFLNIENSTLEIDEKYYLNELIEYPNLSVEIEKNDIIELSNNYLIAKKVGTTDILFELNDVYQKVKFTVCEKGMAPNPKLDIHRLYGKKIIALGDSVTANATIGGDKVYADYFVEEFKMSFKNYAIGGTTLTYMYPGSNIYKEYSTNKTAIDGCRVAHNAFLNNELNDVDYAIIAYGHNDQYFKPAISSANDDNFSADDFSSCYSFKGSFKYIIKLLREANPSMRIIIVNCTYSEYDKSYPSPYGNEFSYLDYMNAAREISQEMNCNIIELWDYSKEFFDYSKGNVYYKDFVHLSSKGHELLGKYFIKLFK